MANTVSLSYTCGCTFTHNTTGSQNVINHNICATHSAKTHPENPTVIQAGKDLITALQNWRMISRN